MKRPPIAVPELAAATHQWSRWWVLMWVVIAVSLLAFIPFVSFGHWVTGVLVLFGIPETIGTWKQDDSFPPLTHVIVRYVDREIAFLLIFFFYGSTGGYWFGFGRPWAMGLFAALLGWLVAHFERRYERR